MLGIETGRHNNIAQDKRFCPFCPNEIEDECHFLIHCPVYTHLRDNLLCHIKAAIIGFFYPRNTEFLFWFLINCPLIYEFVAHFVHNAADLRHFLAAKDKREW